MFCIRIWGKQSPSYMQFLHFAFAIGAFLAPLVAWPFLSSTVSTVGINGSVGLPYQYEAQAFHTIHDTISGKSKENESVGDKSARSVRDLSHFMFPKSGDVSHGLSSAMTGSSSIVWIKHRSRRGLPQPAESDATDFIPSSGLVSGVTANNPMPNPVLVDNSSSPANGTVMTSYMNSSTTTTKPPPLPQPIRKKPKTTNAETLNPDHADGEPNNAKLAYIIRNPQKNLPPDLTVPDTAAPTTKDLLEQDSEPQGNTTNIKVNGSSLPEAGNKSVSAAEGGDSAGSMSPSASIATTSKTTATHSVTPSTPTTTTASTTTTATTTTTTTPTPTTSNKLETTTAAKTSTSSEPSESIFDGKPQPPVLPTRPQTGDTQSQSDSDTTVAPQPNTTANSTYGPQDTFQFFFETLSNMSKIQFAYLVIGLLVAGNSAIFVYLYMRDRAAHRSGPISTPLSHEELTRPPKSACFIFAFLGLLFLFFFTYVGMEVTFGGLLPTFALGFPGAIDSSAGGATLVALFWGSVALGRGVAIFVARWFKPPCMMVVDLSLTLAGALVLAIGISASPKLLWVGTMTLGVGMSSLFPTAMSWAHCYYPLSGRAAAVFVAGCGIGEMTVPALTGQLYHSVTHMALMYVVLACSCLLVVMFVMLQILACQSAKSPGNKFGSPPRSHSGFMRLESSEDMADAVDMDLMGETVLGSEDGGVGIPDGRVNDLASVTRRKRRGGREEEGRSHRENGSVANGAGYDVTEFTKLVELSD